MSSFQDSVDELRTRLQRLEARIQERELEQLELADKVLHKLRERVRVQRRRAEPEPEEDGDTAVADLPPAPPPNTAHLARRFRGW